MPKDRSREPLWRPRERSSAPASFTPALSVPAPAPTASVTAPATTSSWNQPPRDPYEMMFERHKQRFLRGRTAIPDDLYQKVLQDYPDLTQEQFADYWTRAMVYSSPARVATNDPNFSKYSGWTTYDILEDLLNGGKTGGGEVGVQQMPSWSGWSPLPIVNQRY